MITEQLSRLPLAENCVCIIGSGVGSSNLALMLAKRKIPFVIVEAGGIKSSSSMIEKSVIGHPFRLRTTTSIEVGGTSNLWHGVLSPLDKVDFQKRSWIPHSGWPITLDDLEPFYADAAANFDLITLSYFDKKRLPTNLVKLLDEFKFDRNNFVNKIFQQPLPPVRFKDKLLTITKDSDRFHLAYHCCALKLEKDDSGKIVSLLFGQPDGSTHELKAGLFVIGIGALESPRLLLNSGFDNPNIGRFLMDHPMGNLCQIGYKEKRTAHIYSGTMISSGCVIKSGLEFSFSMQREEKLPNHCFYPRVSFSKGIDNKTENVKLSLLTFRDGGVSFKDILNLILNINLVIQILIFKFSLNFKHKYSDLFFVSEQIPNPDSTVTLSKDMKDRFGFPIAEVNWQLTDQDWKSMEETYSLLKNQCFETDFCDFTHESKDLDWKGNMSSAAHHVGTLRMAETAQDGVVDKNLKVFGAENLYVCDGSVFTTSGNVNSSFTIGALACRLAKHLAGNQPAGTND